MSNKSRRRPRSARTKPSGTRWAKLLAPRKGEPKYLGVVRAIEAALGAGDLEVGQRLPPERTLATELGVSRTTTSAAYKELEARGLVRGHVGRGTTIVGAKLKTGETIPWMDRVSRQVSEAAQSLAVPRPTAPGAISFAHGWPDPAIHPIESLVAVSRRVLDASPAALFTPAPPEGDIALREALSAWLGDQGIKAAPAEILVTVGAQEGLNVVARTFLGPGDTVVTEAPTYVGAILAFRQAGAEVIGVPASGHDGIDCDRLEEALIRHRPKLLYVMPNFQHPSGVTLSLDRRRRVLELAHSARIPILESDIYGQIFFESPPPPSLKSLDRNLTVMYQGSFSKMVVPGLRIGWLVAPGPACRAMISAKLVTTIFAPSLSQRIAASFIRGGLLDIHLQTMRRECRRRRDELVTRLNQAESKLRFRVPSGGYYLWAALPAGVSASFIVQAALEKGVALRPGTQFFPERGAGDDHIRLAFAALRPTVIAEGAARLAEVVRHAAKRAPAADRSISASMV